MPNPLAGNGSLQGFVLPPQPQHLLEVPEGRQVMYLHKRKYDTGSLFAAARGVVSYPVVYIVGYSLSCLVAMP